MPSKEKNEPNWKAFRNDTEAGRLLSRLYGVGTSSPQIQYPKLKTKGEDDLTKRSRWSIAAAGKQGAADNSPQKRAIASVHVPKLGKKKSELPSNLSKIPRRKTVESCNKIIEDTRIMRNKYRPPNQMATSTDEEKERLCEVFEYGGGKGLPLELTNPKSELPSKQRTKVGSKASSTDSTTSSSSRDKCPSTSAMANQIASEIKERRAFQSAMEQNSAGDARREDIVDEITKRMKELMKHDAALARKLMMDG